MEQPPDNLETIRRATALLRDGIGVLEGIHEFVGTALLGGSFTETGRAFCLALGAAIETAESLVTLNAGQARYRDSMILARACGEALLNAAFLANNPEAADMARLHAIQRGVRDQSRHRECGSVVVATMHPTDLRQAKFCDECLARAIEAFSTPKGSELSNWAKASIWDKCQFLDEAHGSQVAYLFTAPLFAIYPDASEMIHGSLFGSLRRYGLDPLTLEGRAGDQQERDTVVTIEHLLFMFLGLTRVAARAFDGLPQLEARVREIVEAGGELLDGRRGDKRVAGDSAAGTPVPIALVAFKRPTP